jgi:xylan 1,4-beta-xylosidase
VLQITNPVLRGFHPDPSFVRVGRDYYLATSTFEWWPAVALHHSRDLVHWRPIGHAVTRPSQLDLQGIVDSGGVWAPSLSYADGKFWLIYTNVRTCGMGRPFKDVGIYLITAPSIEGPWSEPVTLNSIGFDPSLFHDDDGRKWLVNMMWDFRPGCSRFAGIVVQEYDPALRQLVGPMTRILNKPVLTEGPNLYKRDGWYYLMLAEGGTGWNHGISMARSRQIQGPYELDPQTSVLTTRDVVEWPLQKAGHGEIVETPSGEWYLAHLASRPVHAGKERRCTLGRETCLQRVRWSKDGWLRLESGTERPEVQVAAPAGSTPHPWPTPPARDDFNEAKLDVRWCTLREAADPRWISLTERPGWLRLRGRESLHSLFHQTLVAKRLSEHVCFAETCLDFSPKHFTQCAGLVLYYDTRTHFYLRVTHHEERGKILGIAFTDDGTYGELAESELVINDWQLCYLRAQINRASLQFSASKDAITWTKIGPELDASKASDDYGQTLHFTGGFVGLCAQDLGGTRAEADFDYFHFSCTEP